MAERAVASGAPAGGASAPGRSLETGNLKRFRTLNRAGSPASQMETAGQPWAYTRRGAERSATGRPDMRDFKGMKRQRNRGRGGGGGGKPQQHNANRAFDSNGPDGVKVRGAAQHIYEKYQQLARDAGSAGDRVLAENNLQHAEHYFRVLRAMQPQRPLSEIIGRDQFASGYDIDFEDEGQAIEDTAEAEGDGGQERQGGDRQWQRDDRPRDDRQRDDRGQGEYRQQGDRPRDDRQRDDRPRDDRDYRGQDRGQGEYRQRDDRGQGGDYRPREDRPAGRVPPARRPAPRRPHSGRPSPRRPAPGRSAPGRSAPGSLPA